ncbi:hypothetical protein BAUCODRAFT_446689 [Baudoinia panamericana UAMH 10762]|uniref:Mediator of RNA polymerase II transcription subunit 18 n=1 Tax=Baudoinia panamericana (strain UAMH 10762) TaxID=717646 RepID=M2MKU9_BAUPA|nr:uncharacterized protein BAUCODRAFT_446689 [Baudoinia panamericana UAMH 10762]EMC97316.1 hypothetical protein BAUCODRAFT_446689 [Baudoinia panamericana UAMH 10762]
MQEFTIYSQIPPARHQQVLNILAGVTAAQPVEVNEQTLIYQQAKPPPGATGGTGAKKVAPAAKKTAAQSLTFQKLIRNLTHGGNAPWLLRVEETPQPGVQNLISRSVNELVANSDVLERFREGSGWYRYVNQYLSRGYRFVLNNVVVKITQVYSVPEGTGALEPLDAPIPAMLDCKLVDPTACYLFEAYIRVDDATNTKLLEQATAELLAFKKRMEGAVDLRVPERLALDTKVKGS